MLLTAVSFWLRFFTGILIVILFLIWGSAGCITQFVAVKNLFTALYIFIQK